MVIDTSKIKELLDSEMSAYEIEKRVSISRTTILQLRNKEKDIESLTLKNAEKLQKFWEEYTMTKKYFNGSYETINLEGSSFDKIQQISRAINDFIANENLSEEVSDYLYDLPSSISKESLNDSEHLYLSFDDIAPKVSKLDEIPTAGELDNGFESVVRYVDVDLENGKTLYLLLTYDI